jgi:transcriptional regulator with XRE-family HTH domain
MDYGHAIKKLRLLREMTQSDLGKAAKLSKGYISKVESGQSMPPMKKLHDVAKALKVPFYLFVLFASDKTDLKGIPEGMAEELKNSLFNMVLKVEVG